MDKIDIRDLRVGNWVMISPWDETPWVPSKITDISFHSWEGTDFCDSVGTEEWDELSLDQIKPIPLTTDIVEKNFNYAVYNEYGYYQLNDDFCLRGLDLKFFLCHWEDVEDSAYQCPKYLFDVDSIHKLQNIIRDLGIKKEITI